MADEAMNAAGEEAPAGMLSFDPSTPPSPDQILSILDSLGLSDKDKDQLKAELLFRKETGEFVPLTQPSFFNLQLVVLAVMLTIIALIFVFFGYKLYRSLTDKERKREEKRKLKQQKKKK